MNIPDSGHRGRVRAPRANLRVDLTPMVDLAFLLITFFMLTTTLLEQRAMRLDAPKIIDVKTPVSECQVLNLLTDSLGQVYCWEGLECKVVNRLSLKGEHPLGEKIKAKKKFLANNCLKGSGQPKDMVCLIKLLPGTQYENMIQVLDEVVTDSVPVYAIQSYTDEEVKAVREEQTKMAMSTP